MSKKDKIQELTEYAMLHLSDMIPYNTPNYDEVLLEESKHFAEVMYELENNPKADINKMYEPLLDIDLPF